MTDEEEKDPVWVRVVVLLAVIVLLAYAYSGVMATALQLQEVLDQ